MGFGIDRLAHARKARGLFRRAPAPREVGERLSRLIKRMERGAVVRLGWKAEDRFVAQLELHPAAPLAVVSLTADGVLSLRARTSMIGPGYHADVLARISPILDELDYEWDAPEPDATDAMCAWLAGELRGDGQRRVGVPADRSFRSDAPVLTALGPRDAAWRDAVLADPRRGADAFAWWQSGAGQGARSRALLAMWLEVPWREPLEGDERELMEQVDTDLRAAHAAGLDVPWADWAELLDNLGADDAHAAKVRAKATGDAVIGYRRLDMNVELSGGWTMCLPGAFVSKWEDDGERYWATDGTRAVEFTSFTANGETDSERLLAVAPERHPVIDRFDDDGHRGRAEAYAEAGVHVVHGLVACAPDVAIFTFKGEARDQPWALATWRSLRLTRA